MDIGIWNINVNTEIMPQKIATAMSKLNETIMGARYEMIAYIGSQLVNGTNHAVLAEQTVIGSEAKNVVMLIFNEKPNEAEAALVAIERVVGSGVPLGGITIDVHTDIPEDVKTIWKEAFSGYVGGKLNPFALLGTKTTRGKDYIFAVEFIDNSPCEANDFFLVIVNGFTKRATFVDMLENQKRNELKYAFSW